MFYYITLFYYIATVISMQNAAQKTEESPMERPRIHVEPVQLIFIHSLQLASNQSLWIKLRQ